MWQAVEALTYRQRDTVSRDNGTTEVVFVDSLLDQVIAMVRPSGEASRGGSSSGKPHSRPPLSVDALTLIVEIERCTESHDLAAGIRTIARTLERTHDTAGQTDFTERLRRWIVRVKAMTGNAETRTRPLPINCPACQSFWVWDLRDGEPVRTYAVFTTFRGDEVASFGCLVCKTTWERGDDLDELVAWQLGQ
uniref:DUF7341 domain-containing protein n=1 Tax=uncultured organism TaxID=155900 RepID=A0A7L9QBW3_9ZZZZ|nr:hypothetical protein [uncultured organism]